MACTSWRGIEERIAWMLDHPPGQSGMCARETWQALGGDQSPPCPPAWGTPDANAVYDNIIASGRYWTSTPIPRGAVVAWRYGENGHLALSAGDGKIVTTDPNGDPGGTGIESLSYPEKWGASASKRVWTDQYNGVRFAIGTEAMPPGDVYVSKLVYGQNDSDSVRRLQETLNGITLSGGSTLPVTGFYGDQTAHEVGLWQTQKATDRSVTDGSHVTVAQADQMFAGTGHTVIDDVTETEPPDPSEPPETITLPLGIEYHYSGKPSGTLSFSGTYKKLDVASWAPKEKGLTFGMIYANVDGSGEFRSRLIREPHGGSEADPTAYQTHYPKGGDNYLLTHVWFESGEAGRPLHYELATMDGETMTVGTRYAKHVTIPWEVVVAVAEVGAAYMAVRRPVVAALRWIRSEA